MKTSKFNIDLPNWKDINLDAAKYILQEANAYLKYQVESTDKITARAFSILTLLIPITSVIIAFFVNEKYKPVFCAQSLIMLLLGVLIALITTMFFLSKLVFPRVFMPIGREPRDICKNDFLVNSQPDLPYLALVLSEIEAVQHKIDYNEIQIAKRVNTLKTSMMSIGGIFIFAVIAAMIFFSSFQ